MIEIDRSAWRRVRFGDVVSNSKETVKDPVAAGLERVVALEHMEPGSLQLSGWQPAADATTFTRRFRSGQTLFAKRRAYQRKVAYADFDGVCSGDILVLEAKPGELLPELLPFIVQSEPFFEHALRTSAGSLSPRTKWQDLAKWEFALPPLPDQTRIAATLWAARQLSARLDARQSALATTRAVIRDRLFDCEYPEVRLEEVCRVASQNGLSKPKEGRSGPVAMVNMGQLFIGEHVDLEGLEHVSLSADERGRFLLSPGDLLFARRSIVFEGAGLCCIFAGAPHDCTFESSVIRVTPDESRVISEFLLHYFRSSAGRRSMSRIVRRGPVSGITGSDLRKMVVPAPPIDVQEAVIGMIGQPDSALRHSLVEEAELRALASLLSRELVEGMR